MEQGNSERRILIVILNINLSVTTFLEQDQRQVETCRDVGIVTEVHRIADAASFTSNKLFILQKDIYNSSKLPQSSLLYLPGIVRRKLFAIIES